MLVPTRSVIVALAGWMTGLCLAAPPASPHFLPERVLPAGLMQSELRTYLHSLVPPFELPARADLWEKQADALRKRCLDEVILRGVPAEWRTGPTRVEWQAELPGQGYRIRKLRYQAVPGLWVGGLLYQPDNLQGKVPAILNVNGHEATGLFTDYVQARSINLAKRGMLVLALEWIGQGQLNGSGYKHNQAAYLDLCGVAGVSVMYLELQRGLDVLLMQPNADTDRVAVSGMSGGGWQTILISSLDTRVKLAVPNAGYTSIGTRIDSPPDLGDYEQCPPGLCAVADYTYLTAMLAPRPALLIYNDKDQCCFRADRSKPAVYDPIVPLYQLFGHPERFAIHINSDPGTHNYQKDNREAFYRFVHRNFVPDATWKDDDIPVDSEIRTQQELAIDYPEGNADFHVLARRLMSDLPRRSLTGSSGAAGGNPDSDVRVELRNLIRMGAVPRVQARTSGPDTRPAGLDAEQQAFTLDLDHHGTLPLFVLTPSRPVRGVDLVLADKSRTSLEPLLQAGLKVGRQTVVVDLWFTGECNGLDHAPYLWSCLLNTLDRRSLGLQVEQLSAVTNWIRSRFADQPIRMSAYGRTSCVAGLMLAAIDPRRFERLDLHGLEPSFKQFLDAGVRYEDAPPVFCVDLLKRADIPDLIHLASPTVVTLQK